MKTSRLIFVAMLFGAALRATNPTTVTDTVKTSQMTPVPGGSISISYSYVCTEPDGSNIQSVFVNVPISSQGVFTVNLAPTDVCAPANTYYTVTYSLPNGITRAAEFWTVPSSASPIGLASVRTPLAPVPGFSVALSAITGGGATTGQSPVWSGSAWLPGTVNLPNPISQLTNFTGQPTGTAGFEMTFQFPATRGTNLYYGYRADIADPLLNGSAAFAVYNTGTADSIFAEVRGAASGATSPTGLAMNLNHIGSVESNSLYAGYGIQIFDYTSEANMGTPMLIENSVGGSRPLAQFVNTGDGPAYINFQSGNVSENENGFIFFNKSGQAQWQFRKNGTNAFQVLDFQNSRVILQSTPGSTSELSAPSGLSVPTQTPASSSAACTTGTITWDSSFSYFCIATNTWKRVAIATW